MEDQDEIEIYRNIGLEEDKLMSTISSHFANDDFLGLFIAKMSTMFEKTESDMIK